MLQQKIQMIVMKINPTSPILILNNFAYIRLVNYIQFIIFGHLREFSKIVKEKLQVSSHLKFNIFVKV